MSVTMVVLTAILVVLCLVVAVVARKRMKK
jgi:preprotein translocase subunit SecG